MAQCTILNITCNVYLQSRFCSNLNLPLYVQRAATYIARKAVDADLVAGRSPISVAAAAIYMASQASKEKRSQKGKGFRPFSVVSRLKRKFTSIAVNFVFYAIAHVQSLFTMMWCEKLKLVACNLFCRRTNFTAVEDSASQS